MSWAELFEKAQGVIALLLLGLLTGFAGWVAKKANEFFAADRRAKVITEVVATVDKDHPTLKGENKMLVALDRLDADKRVGTVTEAEVEAVVRSLPTKGDPAPRALADGAGQPAGKGD